MSIKDQANKLAKGFLGITVDEAHQQHICVSCKAKIEITEEQSNKAGNIYSRAGQREYAQSGMCEYCFDDALMSI